MHVYINYYTACTVIFAGTSSNIRSCLYAAYTRIHTDMTNPDIIKDTKGWPEL